MKSRWLVILPAIWFALFAAPVEAEPQSGLNAVGYTIDEIPPTQSDNLYPTCGSELENNINRNFDWEPFAECGWDWFMVHYTGFISIPENTTIELMVAADDGGTVNIGGYEFGTWNLKGCSWSQVVSPELPGGTYSLDGWFFEAGGSTCYMLAWKIDDGDWEIVPEWAFTTTFTPPTTTTTTTVTSTTVPVTDPPTTSTVQETSTSTSTTTTTSEPPTTTSTSSSTTTTTTTTTVPQTTTTEAPWVPPPTTADTTPPATSTTLEVEVQQPEETLAPVVVEPTEEPQEEQLPPEDTQPIASTSSVVTIPAQEPKDTVTDDTPQDVVVDEPEELLQALDAGVSKEQAATLATNPEVLAVASAEQAKQIFEALNVGELDNAQIEALVAAVQDAPQEVREAFEETINIFGSGFDNYVPLGSKVPVGVRRTLIAATAGLAIITAGTRIRK